MLIKVRKWIGELLRPPEAGDLDGDFSARLLRILIIWLILGASVVVIGSAIYLDPNMRAIIISLGAGFIACVLFLLWMIRLGYERYVGLALSLVILAFVHIPVLVTGGADSPFLSGYAIPVVIAGLLLSRRWAAVVGGLSLASYWYVLATPSAVVFNLPSVIPHANAVVYGVVMVLLVLCFDLARTVQMETDRQLRVRELASRTVAEKYRVMVEALPVVAHVAETGEHGAWLYVSPQIEDMLGFSSEEWMADPDLWARQIHPDDRRNTLADEEKLSTVLSGESTHWEYRFIHRDGHVVWLQDNAVLVWDEELGKNLWHGTFVNITARKVAEDESVRLAREILLLDKVRSALAREVELPALLRTVVESIAAYHGYSLVSIYLLADEELVLQHQVGYENVIERIPITRGVMGKVVRTAQPIFLEDVGTAPDFLGAIEGIVSEISVPLFDQGSVAGTLNVQSAHGNKLTAEDLKLMLALGEHASAAIGRARLYSELQQKNRIESALQESTLAIVGEMELSEVLQAILARAAALMDTAHAYIYLTTPADDEIVSAMGTGIFAQYVGSKLRRGEGLAGKVWETSQALNVADYYTWTGRAKHYDETTFYAVLGVPLISGGRVAGVLGLAHLVPERSFNKEDVELLSRFAQLASIALENARLFTLSQQELFERKQAESLQAAIYRISEAPAKVADLAELFESVHATVGQVMPADNFYIALYDSAQDLLSFPYFVDEADQSLPQGPTRSGRGLTEYVIHTGKPLLCDQVRFEELVRLGEVVEVGPASPIWLGAPLIVEGLTIGVIALQDYSNPLAYGQRELQMLEYVSAQVAKAIAAKNAEEALRESEQRYRGVLNNMIEGCRILGFDWRYIYVNQAAAAQGRSSVEELIGQNMTELYPWIKDTQAFGAMRICMEQRVPVYLETEFIIPEGPTNWFELSIQPVPEGIFILSVDITQQKLALGSLQEVSDSLQTVINSSPLAILGYDRDGMVKSWNPAAERIFGWSADEAVGKLAPYVRADELPEFHVLRERVVHGETITGLELRRHKKDSMPIDISLNLAPTFGADGQIDGYMALIEDISKRKQRERELRALASVSAALRTASTQAEILPIVLDQAMALFDARAATIILHDRFSGTGRIEAVRGVWEYSLGWSIPPGQGASGSVMSSGQPYVTANVYDDPVVFYKDVNEHLPAFISVPLSTPNGFIGTLNVGRVEAFTPEDVRALESVADIAANAMQRTALHELALHRVSQLQALHNIDIAITSSLDLRVTLNVLLDHTIAQLDVDAACILKMSDSLHKFSFAAGRGFETSEGDLAGYDRSATFSGRVAGERRSIIISEIRQETMPIWFSSFLSREKFVSYIGVPLLAKGTLVGVLEVFHRSPIQASSEWVEFLETLATQAALAMDNAELFTGLQQSNVSLALSYDATIEGWSRALDLRDKETEGHTQRVTNQTIQLAHIMQIPEEQITHIRRGALLHDIGKMGVPDSILLKPAPLTDAEWLVMRRHPQYAYDLISPIRYLEPAIDIPFCHHEKWDGSGYPRGLAGERIPLAARIFTVVDVWDALTSNRPYREAWPDEKVLDYIREHAGTHFDPKVVEIFLRTRQNFS